LRGELEEAQRQVVQAAKIASLGRLAAGVAHEINNPLAGILIYADMLMKEVDDTPSLRQDLEEIINQTLRCKEIVTRLLEFSRQSLGERSLFDVNELIHQSAKLLRHQALFHDIELILNLQTDLPQMLGDPGEIQQIFTNLMLNAADAMEGKGRLTISSLCDQQSDQIVLKFADTGPGVLQENFDKIFEPFFTTKLPGEGTGLGLSLVYGVIQRHGGTIEVESPQGGGAVFLIRLPLAAPEKLPEAIEI
jgi:signal transduction histidine kinase